MFIIDIIIYITIIIRKYVLYEIWLMIYYLLPATGGWQGVYFESNFEIASLLQSC